ncbi:MAG: hypothetical protein WC752_02495 [Patescibacteria group bacterium]|jgi:hypothetical protein
MPQAERRFNSPKPVPTKPGLRVIEGGKKRPPRPGEAGHRSPLVDANLPDEPIGPMRRPDELVNDTEAAIDEIFNEAAKEATPPIISAKEADKKRADRRNSDAVKAANSHMFQPRDTDRRLTN